MRSADRSRLDEAFRCRCARNRVDEGTSLFHLGMKRLLARQTGAREGEQERTFSVTVPAFSERLSFSRKTGVPLRCMVLSQISIGRRVLCSCICRIRPSAIPHNCSGRVSLMSGAVVNDVGSALASRSASSRMRSGLRCARCGTARGCTRYCQPSGRRRCLGARVRSWQHRPVGDKLVS